MAPEPVSELALRCGEVVQREVDILGGVAAPDCDLVLKVHEVASVSHGHWVD